MEGRKEDVGKPPLDIVPTDWMVGLSRVCEYGREKYGADNWRKGFKWSRLYAAALRHLFKFWDKEDFDVESGKHHLLHAAWNCLALYWYSLRRKEEEDDRPNF